MADKTLKILFLSPEVVPFAKSGGLADVAGSLPLALKSLGMEVRIVLPYYRVIKDGDYQIKLFLKDFEVPLGEENLKSDVFKTFLEEEIPVYLLDREDLYDRPNLYGNVSGDYYDNLERFTLFCHGALRLTQQLDFRPDIIHCHDWQTGIVPALLKGPYKSNPRLSGASTVFTIHNIGYQGTFPTDKLPITGLSRADFLHLDGVEYWGKISLLKAGIVYSDAITTVSPTYSKEIQTSEYGMGMEGILESRRDTLYGILNGVDYKKWDPETDTYIDTQYSAKRLSGKQKCKKALIREMNLDPSLEKRPLLGILSRLDAQKGLDIIIKVLDQLLAKDIGLIILGTGNSEIEAAIKKKVSQHRSRLGTHFGFNEALAHKILAGSDIFLMPSRERVSLMFCQP
ncbi:glycogen synthase, partial [Thermodesulfobacteriota bacterium]